MSTGCWLSFCPNTRWTRRRSPCFTSAPAAGNWCRSARSPSSRQSLGPLVVNHSGQLPSVTVSFNLQPGTALGDAVNRVEQIARQTLPSDLSANFEGTAQQFQSSLVGLSVLLVITILVIYIVLGILYESFIHPLTILSGLPSAALGALLTLMYFGYELDLYGFVGIIMLVGIVKKNAIMMIDFALDAERNAGKTTRRGHLLRSPGALPAHHDDHHGGADGNAAHRHWALAPARNRAVPWASASWAGWSSPSSSPSTSPRSITPTSTRSRNGCKGSSAARNQRPRTNNPSCRPEYRK